MLPKKQNLPSFKILFLFDLKLKLNKKGGDTAKVRIIY